jgi:hypothetical protein
MPVRRSNLFWGVFLLLAGGVPLLVRGNVIDGGVVADAWRLWPVALIVAGLGLILFRRLDRTPVVLASALVLGLFAGGVLAGGSISGIDCSDAGANASQLTRSGTFQGRAAIHLELNCGTLLLTSADAGGWTLDARYTGDAPVVTASDTELSVESRGGGPLNDRQTWNVRIPRTGVSTVSGTINAGTSTFDLGTAQLDAIDLHANAGELVIHAADAALGQVSARVNAGTLTVTLGAREISGDLSSNAGQINLCVPAGVGLDLTVSDNITFSQNLDERGLEQNGSTWTRAATNAAATIHLEISGNASSFELDPSEGCA